VSKADAGVPPRHAQTGHRNRVDIQRARADFTAGRRSFIPGLLPPDALALPVGEVIALLSDRHGAPIENALQAAADSVAPAGPGASQDPASLPASGPPSPVGAYPDPSWLRRAHVVGINIRTVGSFWRVVHYALTLPQVFNAIHLLPVWEPGVVGSLYGMASWQINGEFFDDELAQRVPGLNTATAQLRATVNVLHACGRAVGMDVIPHTDRFSEIVLAQPSLFEWLKRDDRRIRDHRANLHEEAEELIYAFVRSFGRADNRTEAIPDRTVFFSPEVTEADRCRIIFGPEADPDARNRRRGTLVRFVHAEGLEPVPATMAPPYRGIEVDPETRTVDGEGDVWLDYRITSPQPMSRVFGPLTRYKLYERVDDNRNWEIDFEHPRRATWEYVISHYGEVQRQFGFDFMRGDMSHVQMRPSGVPADIPEYYDILGAVKTHVRDRLPSFGYFAETFLAPPGVMAYGDEVDHLEASAADVTLGDLQSVAVADDEFAQRLRSYLDIADTRRVCPCFTVMTADKDDPRFDSFYVGGNELRTFCARFLPSLPSYTALGFEMRDEHRQPVANEFYSKLYVFQVSTGRHATRGPYRFGGNAALFDRLQRIHLLDDGAVDGTELTAGDVRWLLPPDATAGRKVIAWACIAGGRGGEDTVAHDAAPDLCRVFVANCDTVSQGQNVKVPLPWVAGASANGDPADREGGAAAEPRCIFSTIPDATETRAIPARDGFHIARLGRGECRIYELRRNR